MEIHQPAGRGDQRLWQQSGPTMGRAAVCTTTSIRRVSAGRHHLLPLPSLLSPPVSWSCPVSHFPLIMSFITSSATAFNYLDKTEFSKSEGEERRKKGLRSSTNIQYIQEEKLSLSGHQRNASENHAGMPPPSNKNGHHQEI